MRYTTDEFIKEAVDIGRYKHTQALSIDALAQISCLKKVIPTLKFRTLLVMILISVSSRNILTGIFLIMVIFTIAVLVNGLSLNRYVHILVLQVSFLLIGGIALLFEVSSQPAGVLNQSHHTDAGYYRRSAQGTLSGLDN